MEKDKKIHILFDFKEGPYGGANQFLKALRNFLLSKNSYTDEPFDSDILLLNSFDSRNLEFYSLIKKIALRKRIAVIHRIAGPIQIARGIDKGLDKQIYEVNELFADGNIFQSEWSKYENKRLGLKAKSFEKVIINAPDSSIFYPSTSKVETNKLKLILTSWSNNPLKGGDVIDYLIKNLNFEKYELTLVGNYRNANKNLRVIPKCDSKSLSNILREHDIYIFPSYIEACSNALIEALHCGLPAVARNSSSNPEIIGKGGELFNDNSELLQAIEKVAANLDFYRNSISLPEINEVGEKYYNFCCEVYNNTSFNSKIKIKYLSYLNLYFKLKCNSLINRFFG